MYHFPPYNVNEFANAVLRLTVSMYLYFWCQKLMEKLSGMIYNSKETMCTQLLEATFIALHTKMCRNCLLMNTHCLYTLNTNYTQPLSSYDCLLCCSTISSIINATATVLLADIVRPLRPSLTDTQATIITKVLSLVIALLSVVFVLFARNFGHGLISVSEDQINSNIQVGLRLDIVALGWCFTERFLQYPPI